MTETTTSIPYETTTSMPYETTTSMPDETTTLYPTSSTKHPSTPKPDSDSISYATIAGIIFLLIAIVGIGLALRHKAKKQSSQTV